MAALVDREAPIEKESFRAGRDSASADVRPMQAAHHYGAATIHSTEIRRRSSHGVFFPGARREGEEGRSVIEWGRFVKVV
jgi:hypothetical protein